MDSGIAVMALPSHQSSFPVPIPISRLKQEFHATRRVENNSQKNHDHRQLVEKRTDPHHKVESESSHSGADDEEEEEFRLPDGSPTFTAVMSEMSSQMSKVSVRDHVKIPVLPMVSTESEPKYIRDYGIGSPGSNSPESMDFPISPRKNGNSPPSRAQVPRSRSYSWNHRNKMVVDRRKALSVTFQVDSDSNTSSPVVQRKKKMKPRPFTSHPVPAHPKYKILSENISVSHDNLVKEQERERHLAEGFSEVKSIFHSQWFDRLGVSPTQN